MSPAARKFWLVTMAILGGFFLWRGVWVGAEGLLGRIRMDWRDWTLTALFVSVGVRLLLRVSKGFRQIRRERSKTSLT